MKKLVFASSILSLLVGCANQPGKWSRNTNDKIQQTLVEAQDVASIENTGIPAELTQALLPPINIGLPNFSRVDPVNQKFDVAVNNVSAQDVYLNLVKDTPFGVMVDPSVKGNVTLSLNNVTIDDVFEHMQQAYSFNFEKHKDQYFVFANTIRSRIFQVNYLNLEREGTSRSDITSGGLGAGGGNSGVKIETKNSVKFWENLSKSLTVLIGNKDGRNVIVNEQSGYIVVSAMPNELRVVEEYLSNLQSSISRQVILEAKLLEVELNDGFQTGINWANLVSGSNSSVGISQTGGGTALTGSNTTSNIGNSTSDLTSTPISALGAAAFGGVFSVALQSNNFGAFIEMISTQGDVHVLSSPRIAAVNNQKAVIKVGGEEYFVTGVQPGSTATQAGGGVTESTPSVEMTSFFSGIALDVTPQIDNNGNITLHLHPTVSEVSQKNKSFVVSGKGFELPLATSSVRETDTIVRAKSGQVIVVGGLMKESTADNEASIPWLGDLPIIGNLFKHKKVSRIKKELVVLVRPSLVETSNQWSAESTATLKQFSTLARE